MRSTLPNAHRIAEEPAVLAALSPGARFSRGEDRLSPGKVVHRGNGRCYSA